MPSRYYLFSGNKAADTDVDLLSSSVAQAQQLTVSAYPLRKQSIAPRRLSQYESPPTPHTKNSRGPNRKPITISVRQLTHFPTGSAISAARHFLHSNHIHCPYREYPPATDSPRMSTYRTANFQALSFVLSYLSGSVLLGVESFAAGFAVLIIVSWDLYPL